MTHQIQELINKIQEEGVAQAQEKARVIESEAQKNAAAIVMKATQDADNIRMLAETENRKKEAALRLALTQAARDTVISVRAEIARILKRIISIHVKKALTPETLAAMLKQLGKESSGEWVVRVSPEDIARLQEGYIALLQDELKKKIVLESRDDIHAGLSISFNAGKTLFDFTDENLANYISGMVTPELAKILTETVTPH